MIRIALVVLPCCVLTLLASSVSAQSLAYSPAPGAKFQYEIEIRLEFGTTETRLQGVTHYTADVVSDDELRLTFHGGLRESAQSKSRRAISPMGFRSRNLPPFGPPTFRGKIQTTNKITLSPQGEVIALQGDSQLPFILGNLSLLPFEPLPTQDITQWETEGTTMIASVDTRDRWMRSPFHDANDRDLRSAKTKQTYRIVSDNDSKTVIKKTYELIVPPSDEETALQLSGSGTWTFDKQSGMPEAMDFQYQLTLKLGDSVVTTPLTLKYHRLTEQEITKREAEAASRAAEAKQKAAEQKAIAERPLTAEEKTKLLQAMRSTKAYDRVKALQTLAGKLPTQPDPEIIAAIGLLLEDSDRAVKATAIRALEKWDAGFKEINKLVSAYNSHIPLKSSNLKVDETTPLFPGQILQVQQSNGWWKAATVSELLASGRVEVIHRGPWKTNEIVTRDKLQLAPKLLPQPNRPKPVQDASVPSSGTTPSDGIVTPTGGEALSPMRTWTDASGAFTFDAKLVVVAGDRLVLSGKDGKVITVALGKLCQKDQAFIEKKIGEKKKPEPINPFAP